MLTTVFTEDVEPRIKTCGRHESSGLLPLGSESAHHERDHLGRGLLRERQYGRQQPKTKWSVVGVDKYVGLSDVTPIRRVLDYELSAGAMCDEEKRDHSVDDVVSSFELGSMFGSSLVGTKRAPSM